MQEFTNSKIKAEKTASPEDYHFFNPTIASVLYFASTLEKMAAWDTIPHTIYGVIGWGDFNFFALIKSCISGNYLHMYRRLPSQKNPAPY